MTSDAGKLKQILYNLLSNAIKFTPEGGRVALSTTPVGPENVRLTVADTGPGIPGEYLGVIFEKFRQIDQSKTREHSGTGLGLAISRELATILGGSISAESEVGRGSTFSVILPVRAPQADAARDWRGSSPAPAISHGPEDD
jgi:two-component system, NarL family, sensor histidine kinase BarA